jgi:alpha-beta hydrolase superfamily lysophospholipase
MTDLFVTATPVDDARGTFVLVHGLGEHSGRYAHVIDALRRARFSVIAYDQRGHGRSPGARGALPNSDALLTDLADVIDAADIQGRLLLFGHSMGGAVAGRFVAEERRKVDGLVLSSPALARTLSAFDKMRLAIGERLTPNLALHNGLDASKISHDPHVVDAYRNDPLVHDLVTPRLVRFILDAGDYVREHASTWRVPTLLLWAGDDHLVDASGSRAFANAAPRELVTAQELPGLYHEIFNEAEPARSEVFGLLSDWLA